MNPFIRATGVALMVALPFVVVYAFKHTASYQTGNPGLGMEMVATTDDLAATVKANEVPVPLPAASAGGQIAVDAYKNVQVLGHLSSGEFTRLMTAMTLWVSPEQGCAYCHAPQRDSAGNPVKDEDGYVVADLNNMQSDELYTKVVARRMLQMTMHINQDWQTHVVNTGVTCYTCHRGNNVPANVWFNSGAGDDQNRPMMGERAFQNRPDPRTAYASLPSNTFETFLRGDSTANIRVQSTQALPGENRSSLKQTEWTYGLMMHMSSSLGVNCTYCHNSRSMGVWESSPPARSTAWYGIRMVRDLNHAYVEPLATTLPANRMGPLGDSPKVNCATCHNAAYKPLLGVSMLKDYVALAEAKPQPAKTAPADEPALVPAAPQ